MSRGLIIFRAAAVFVGLGVIVFLGPGFGRTLRPPPQRILDFFQEWASARNYWNGLPIYTPQEVTARRYLGFEPPNRPYFLLRYNGHPPTSVLLALPFAWLDYSDAFLAWNLLSLVCFAVSIVLVFRNLGVRFPAWGIIPGLALLLFCNPFRQQTLQGQLNLVLLLLLTGVWVADRDGRRVLAGILLGTATCLKLFPGFLFLYFLLKRRWAAVAAGAGTVAALTGVTGLVLGWDAYRDYAQIVIPELARYRGQWTNVSLLGFWEKLFGMGHRTIPLWPSPLVAHAGYLASSLLVTGLAVSAIVRARTPAAGDGAFGLSLVAMVLVSPIAWDHYFLMLLLPVTLVGQRLPTSWSYRLTFALCLLIGWLTPLLYWQRLIPGLTLDNWMTLTADPAQVITALSFPTYALLGLFVLCSALGESEAPDGAAEGVGGGGVSTDPGGQFPGEGAAPAVEPGADAGSETEMVVGGPAAAGPPTAETAPPPPAADSAPPSPSAVFSPAPVAAVTSGAAPGSDTTRAVAVLLLAGLCAYHNSFTGVFVMDDISAIHDNPDIRSVVGDSVWSWIVRPVLYRSLAVNYWLGGLNVRGYHAVNLAIHLLAAGTLFGLLRQTLRLPRFRGRYHDSATGLAGVAALLWLVHPLNTQSVTYIVQRAESMMGLFYLLVLYCLVRGASSSHPTRWYVAAITSSALGMGCKQVMVTAPLTALLYDRTFLTGSLGKSLRARWPVYLSLALTWLVLVPELVYTDPARAGAGFRFQSITPLAYALAQPGVILHYLRLSFWPVGLCLDYNDWPGVSHWFDAWPELAAIAVLVLAALVALARGSGFGFLGTAFFLILAPTSSIMPIADLAFEHRMYLSLACLVVSVVLAADAGLRRLQAWWRWSDGQRDLVGATMVAAVALVLTVLTIERNEVYGSEWGMYRDVLAKRPNNARAYAVLGRLALRAGRLDEALAYNRKAVELSDTYAVAHNNLGVVYRRLGRVSDALRHFHRASEIDPHLPSARNNLGVTLLQRGRPEQVALAVDFLRQAVALAPRSAKFRFDLASGLVAAGRAEEAAQQFAEGLRLDPGWLAIVAREAWRLATTDLARQPGAADEAIFLARQACQATGFSQAEPLDILGAAYAAAGRFDDAVTTARQALDWLPAHAPAEQRRAIEQRLRLYEKRSPYQASAD